MTASEGERRKEERDWKGSVVRLRLQTLVIISFLALAAIGVAYLAGVMSGRQSFSAERSVSDSGEVHNIPKMPDLKNSEDSGAKESILAAEELKFAKVLRNEENAQLNRLKEPPDKKDTAEAQDSPPEKADIAPRPSLKQTLEAEKGDTTEDYLFQVGAFKDEKTVDNLREKLEGHGLRTMMQKEGKLFLVLVRLRGTSARAAELAGLFGELGLGEPILLRRSPVNP